MEVEEEHTTILTTILTVTNKIVSLRLEGKTDEEIDEIFLTEIFEDQLHFGLCKQIDNLLCTSQCGGYWRRSYDFPNSGDAIKRPRSMVFNDCDNDQTEVIGVVFNCGFFTCDIEWQE